MLHAGKKTNSLQLDIRFKGLGYNGSSLYIRKISIISGSFFKIYIGECYRKS